MLQAKPCILVREIGPATFAVLWLLFELHRPAMAPSLIQQGLSIDSEEAARYTDLFKPVSCRKGEVLLAQGECWHRAILVERGLLRLFFVDGKGREFNKNFFEEGALLLPLTKVMRHEPSLFGVAAMEAGRLWIASMEALHHRLSQAQQWQRFQRRALAFTLDHKLQREHDLLALNARERYEHFCRQRPSLASRVPLAQLASYLGMTDVSLSRIRRQLQNDRA
ncbi:MAG: Crp/Fnr family transcriptional regulator [Aquabacterium sp.]